MNYSRQEGIIPSRNLNNSAVDVVGCGGTGSNAALMLLKMGISSVNVFDYDVVEPHNLPSQMLAPDYRFKVDAFGWLAYALGYEPNYNGFKTRYEKVLSPIVVSGVDSNESRLEIASILRDSKDWSLYLDIAMGGEYGTIIALDPTVNWREYENRLMQPVEPLPCSATHIAYNTAAISAVAACLVKRYLNREKIPVNNYSSPVTLDLEMLVMYGGLVPLVPSTSPPEEGTGEMWTHSE